jgi:hypothetical protein
MVLPADKLSGFSSRHISRIIIILNVSKLSIIISEHRISPYDLEFRMIKRYALMLILGLMAVMALSAFRWIDYQPRIGIADPGPYTVKFLHTAQSAWLPRIIPRPLSSID